MFIKNTNFMFLKILLQFLFFDKYSKIMKFKKKYFSKIITKEREKQNRKC